MHPFLLRLIRRNTAPLLLPMTDVGALYNDEVAYDMGKA